MSSSDPQNTDETPPPPERIILWEGEWNATRRAAAALRQAGCTATMMALESKEKMGHWYSQQAASVASAENAAFHTSAALLKNPYVVLPSVAAITAFYSRRLFSPFGMARNAVLAAGVAGGALFPREMVSLCYAPHRMLIERGVVEGVDENKNEKHV
eukprot:gb/GECH01010242.1/.p1 GENE.gb/GECH01010242.1/~~gb/GECH01010242.1/.p1  ORF type:complete len:157 (+),score=40.01 gb/GECH01010242.1/:1-471(+)